MWKWDLRKLSEKRCRFLSTVYPLLKAKHVSHSVFIWKGIQGHAALSVFLWRLSTWTVTERLHWFLKRELFICLWTPSYIQGLSLMINNMWHWLCSWVFRAPHPVCRQSDCKARCYFLSNAATYWVKYKLQDSHSIYYEQGCTDPTLPLLNRSDISAMM